MEITVINDTDDEIITYSEDFSVIAEKLRQKLDFVDSFECAVIFIDDQKMREINANYRNIDAVTDVISFALKDSDDDYETCAEVDNSLGDIFINVAAVARQADSYQHSKRRETLFLFTHGLLHLLGYDHQSADQEKVMLALQKEVLNEIH